MKPWPAPAGTGAGLAGGAGGWMAAPRAEDLVIGPRTARFRGRLMPVEIGRGGFTRDKREGDMASPVCVTHLRRAWVPARIAHPAGPLPLRVIGPDLGWGDDPARPGYNAPVPLSARGGRGAERMLRPDRLYRLVVETGWNAAAPVPGRGSAIFLHVRKGPGRWTAGCAAFREADLRWILARWTRRSRVFFGR